MSARKVILYKRSQFLNLHSANEHLNNQQHDRQAQQAEIKTIIQSNSTKGVILLTQSNKIHWQCTAKHCTSKQLEYNYENKHFTVQECHHS